MFSAVYPFPATLCTLLSSHCQGCTLALSVSALASALSVRAFAVCSCSATLLRYCQVSGIHVQQMMDKSVVVIDRTDAVNTLLKLPNGNVCSHCPLPLSAF